MAIKLYGFPQSTCTRRVATVLAEKDISYEMIALDFGSAEHKKPEYLKLQPFGKVPLLDDNGFFVHESRAITKYIAAKYASRGNPLLPEFGDLKAYALFEQVELLSSREM
jgi:glutathione S-transferase